MNRPAGCAGSVVLDEQSARASGALLRPQRPGPEADMVSEFLTLMPIHVPPRHKITVFREPRIESGYPDLVLVVWDPARTAAWRTERHRLTRDDLRLMHYVHETGPVLERNLMTLFTRRVTRQLSRLEAAGMLRLHAGCWAAAALSSCFAARQIIAVEAKISAWAAALWQATVNTWFASASYILLPTTPRMRQRAEAAHHGVHVWAQGAPHIDAYARRASSLPRSYASWQFNEWAWRAEECDAN